MYYPEEFKQRLFDGMVSVQELADELQKSPDTIMRWSRAGKLPPTIRLSWRGEKGWNYFKTSELEACLTYTSRLRQDQSDDPKPTNDTTSTIEVNTPQPQHPGDTMTTP